MPGVLGLLLPRGAAQPLSAVSALYVPSTQRCVSLFALAMRWLRDCQELAALHRARLCKACRAYAVPFDVRFLQWLKVPTEYSVRFLQGYHCVAA